MSQRKHEIAFSYPEKFMPLVENKVRNKVAKGGRGSAKSESFAQLSVEKTHTERHRVLCCRELQKSIKESVHQTIKDCIYEKGLEKYYHITDTGIRSKRTGSEYLFLGVRSNPNEIKSLKGITICWIEEGEGLSEKSLDVLGPTIRKIDAEIWVSYNPETKNSPCDKVFVQQAQEDSIIVEMNWRDNPWFHLTSLPSLKDHCKKVDYEKYLWIWEGQYKKYAEDVIFKNKIEVDCEFEAPEGTKFYFGLDFGFSTDPLSASRLWEKEDGEFKDLYIDYEVYGLGIELDDMHEKLWNGLPGLGRNPLMADSARPDTISLLRRKFIKAGKEWSGINCIGANKKKGSLEDGIEFLRSYRRIYIHKRCEGAKDDYQNYRWARDAQTNEILTEPVDKANHTPDNNRYALEKLMKRKVSGFDAV